MTLQLIDYIITGKEIYKAKIILICYLVFKLKKKQDFKYNGSGLKHLNS